MFRNAKVVILFLLIITALTYFATSPLYAQSNKDCLECHGGKITIEEYEQSKHGKMSCVSCHQGKEVLPHPEVMQGNKQEEKISESCSSCHSTMARDYETSIHKGSANCIDCHGSHYIMDKSQPKAMTNPINNDEVCGRCHGGRVLKSYNEGFHGTAVNLGSQRSASCVSCHDSHKVLSSRNEEAITHISNVAEMCSKCHGKAISAFASWNPHSLPEKTEGGIYSWYTLKIFTWLIIFTISFFLIYIILDLFTQYRKLRRE